MPDILPSPTRASEWLVALQEAPHDELLRARFRSWLAASHDHVRDWQEIENLDGVLVAHLERLPPPGRSRSPRRLPVWGVAGAALAACLLLMFGPALILRLQSDYITSAAETRTIRLNDGTTVELAPQSAIALEDADGRRVRLLKGEAFFKVIHNPARPFAVLAQNVETMDIGTAFDVQMTGNHVAVGVREGLVAARVGGRAMGQIRPGEVLKMTEGAASVREAAQADTIGAWTNGQLVVKDQPASEVVEALRPYFDGFIWVRDDALLSQPLTGVYDLSDPAKALNAIAAAQKARVYRVSPWVLVFAAR